MAQAARTGLSIRQAGALLREGVLSCEQLVEAFLHCARELQPRLNPFITVTKGLALEQARLLDKERKAGRWRGPLHGIPIVYKDNIDTAQVATTRGSEVYRNRLPHADAVVVTRLRSAGAVTLGKTNMNEFAAGGKGGFNAFYGNTLNPWDPERESGGSSGGTCVAVAAGLCLGGIGTDTGGSIRGPSCWCGVVGLRPTHGLVDSEGIYPRGPSMDVAGPVARTVADTAALLGAMTGPAGGAGAHLAELGLGVAGLRVGTLEGFTLRGADREVSTAVAAAVQVFAALGAHIRDLVVPLLEDGSIQEAAHEVLLYEFSRLLADTYFADADRDHHFGPIVHADMERGMKITESSYRQSLAYREPLRTQLAEAFATVDLLLVPTMPGPPPPYHSQLDVSGRHRTFTIPFSFCGFPALSLPCGFGHEGLPVGLQMVGRPFGESLLLRAATAYEQVTPWHTMTPPHFCASQTHPKETSKCTMKKE